MVSAGFGSAIWEKGERGRGRPDLLAKFEIRSELRDGVSRSVGFSLGKPCLDTWLDVNGDFGGAA